MLKFPGIILTVIVTSLFLFPFNLNFVAGVNTKMVVAVLGLVLFVLDKSMGRALSLSKDFLILSGICLLVSIWALAVTVINRTGDMSFASYLISIWVWLGAAYAVVWLIRTIHGTVSVELIGNYLIAVAVAQCILAYAMTLVPSLKVFIDNLMGESEMFMGTAEGRIYGLGASLDPSGLRFSAILLIIAHLIVQTDFSERPLKGLVYLISFAIIATIGNMIARTTTVGAALALLYLIISPLLGTRMASAGAFWAVTAPVLLLIIVISVWLYNTNPQFQTDLRFGFEGFFSLAEKGRWEVRSNDILRGMVVWPDSLHTWIIGDGYFDSPSELPDRFGRTLKGFYMQTDIGYLRYIFYFGVVGLLGMVAVAVQMTVSCCKAMKQQSLLFISFLIVTLIGWFKVSSDVVMVFAPFLIMAYMTEPEECGSSIA